MFITMFYPLNDFNILSINILSVYSFFQLLMIFFYMYSQNVMTAAKQILNDCINKYCCLHMKQILQ